MGGQGWTCRTCRRTSADKRAVSLATVRVSALSVLGAWVGYPCECLAHPRYSDIAGEDVLFRKAQGGGTGAKDDREGPTGERMPTTDPDLPDSRAWRTLLDSNGAGACISCFRTSSGLPTSPRPGRRMDLYPYVHLWGSGNLTRRENRAGRNADVHAAGGLHTSRWSMRTGLVHCADLRGFGQVGNECIRSSRR